MKTKLFFLLIILIIGGILYAEPPKLKIEKSYSETPLSSLYSADSIVFVSNQTNIHVFEETVTINKAIVCGDFHKITLTADAWVILEVQYSDDLKVWKNTNIRFISDGLPINYYLPEVELKKFYRVVTR